MSGVHDVVKREAKRQGKKRKETDRSTGGLEAAIEMLIKQAADELREAAKGRPGRATG